MNPCVRGIMHFVMSEGVSGYGGKIDLILC
jgi:hypothetical protein